MSTVTFAGFSRLNGSLKFRTANDIGRAQQLAKLGDTDIDMSILPTAMTKVDAAKFVLANLDRYTVDVAEATALLSPTAKDTKVSTVRVKKSPGAKVKVKASKKSKAVGDSELRTIPGTNRVISYDLVEMSEAEKTRIREEHNAKYKHLSHEDLV
jgi:hypothetical protein